MKRKAEDARQSVGGSSGSSSGSRKKSKTALDDDSSADAVRKRFRADLFDAAALAAQRRAYAASAPYRHGVIDGLVDDGLLRAVRDEVRRRVHFTPKETDIYRIHQSGDLANLDGLDDAALAELPSLLALRDAVYSPLFRDYVSAVTGCGPLSGRKTDMAVNVYTPGCYLLCHDDVIGSRRVSYILYLTDPDDPWRPEWGGAIRLYPVQRHGGGDDDGSDAAAKTPLPDVAKAIPPAWNQLSFFAVQPGESFHDVEEVYHADAAARHHGDMSRVRMAISGWFHIPQPGENGYVEGEEERNARNSSLMQLRADPDQYDQPQPRPVAVTNPKANHDAFDEADLEFLLKYIAPTFLTPDTLEQIADHFGENSTITLADILCKKFASRLKDYVVAQEKQPLPEDSSAIEQQSPWRVARPPHKHRFLYQQPAGPADLRTSQQVSPITELLDTLLPSRQFRQWLQMATGCTVESSDVVARRFRRGHDYTLATGHDGKLRLELNLGITPTPGWGDDADDEAEETEPEAKPKRTSNKAEGKVKDKGKRKDREKAREAVEKQEREDLGDDDDDVGGHEVYMAGDDDADQDAAVYKSAGAGDDDNILFFQAAAWNKLTIILRDSGTLRFVKYVSRRAPGDRWDISGVFEVDDPLEADDATGANGNAELPLGDSEEEFNGFSDSVDSDSG